VNSARRWSARRRALLTEARRRRARERGTPVVYWTNPQRAILESDYRLTVAWGANGIGKSMVLAELVRRAIAGDLHWQRSRSRVVILAGRTWKQIGATLQYLWKSVDKSWFRGKVRFEDGALKGQRETVYDIVDGPGKGSTLVCAVFNAETLAGPRSEVVITDEPLPRDVHDELWPRLFGRGGRMYVGFTPTMGTCHKLDYLWDLVDDTDKPFVGEIHIPLTLDAVTPRGGLVEVPWVTQQEIDDLEAGLSALSVDMRMGRSRHPMRDTAFFMRVWGPHLVTPRDVAGGWELGIGVDYGNKPGATRAILIAADRRKPSPPVHVIAEYKAKSSKTDDHAQGVLDMIDRAAIVLGGEYDLRDIDVWIGDRAHSKSSFGPRQSNLFLKRAIAKALGHRVGQGHRWLEKLPRPLQRMYQPAKHLHPMWEGFAELHGMMAEGAERLTLDPSVVHLRRDIEEWQGSTKDPAKDGLDALRYIVIGMTEGTRR